MAGALPFLSEAWVAALGDAAGAVAVDPSIELVLQHDVEGSAGYWLELRGGRVACGLGQRHDATVTYRVSRAVARSVALGELAPADAFIAGELKVAGRVAELLAAAPALEQVAAATASLRERTEFA